MRSFRYFLPTTNLIFGKGSLKYIGVEAKKLGKKALLVTGKKSMEKLGFLKKVVESMEKEGLEVVHYGEVEPNPTVDIVNEGAEKSIDNHFMLLALNHGLVAVFSQLILFFYLMMRLFKHAISRPVSNPAKSGIDLMLFGILLHLFWSGTTVGLFNINPLVFMIFGWSEGYLLNRQNNTRLSAAPIYHKHLPFHFKRVLT